MKNVTTSKNIDMKDTYYFSHDYNARSDEKIKHLIRKCGMAGYGIYWAIIEDLYINANAMRLDYEGIAYDLHSDVSIVKSVINDFDLFIIDVDTFGSLSVERRLEERIEKSVKAKESANYRWCKKQEHANAMRAQCDSNAIKESKVKESIISISSKNDDDVGENDVKNDVAITSKDVTTPKNINIDFEEFWSLYDKKVGPKERIQKKWEKLKDSERAAAMEYIPKYKASQPDKKYRKNPETFLNQKGWGDELIPRSERKMISFDRMKPGQIFHSDHGREVNW